MNATAAKPAVGGAISYGATTITLPTDATSTPSNVTNVGYLSKDGVKRNISLDSDVIKAWCGDVVLVLEKGKTETFKFVMIEPARIAALKLIHGDSAVSGSALATGIAVQSNGKEKGPKAFIIDMIEAENTLHRICIPKGVVTAIDEITYNDSGAVGYGVTITGAADDNGNTCYEYFQTASASSSTPAATSGE